MSTPILATKLYVPPPRPELVLRPRLIERLDESLHRRLILVSAPAGFGKTTLLGEWITGCEKPAAWLSLDEGDNDPTRFLAYLITALRTVVADVGEGVLGMLQTPQPPSTEVILTALINEITNVPDDFVLVFDDYHVINAEPVDDALTFLIDHLPPRMHLVIATREDPQLPLPRLRARAQLTELRAADLRFTPDEADEFLGRVMGLNLSQEEISALEERTEGWIASLQMAALSMQGRADTGSFIESFTGSHHFVLDYLVEEVLGQQSESVQTFLLRTSILDRMCRPLCDAVVLEPSISGQETLEYLEHANLFIVPLDEERRWYRYHHLFAELLRQRLQGVTVSAEDEERSVGEYHVRASQWYEDNGLYVEAFRHAAAAGDVDRAARLIEGDGIPRHFRGAVITILDWLESLPKAVMDARPSLWWRHASLLLINGHTTGVEEKLRASEAALQSAEPDDKTRNLLGQIAAARATLAVTRYQVETMLTQSRRALEHLHPDNLFVRGSANWTLGLAHQFKGDRAAAAEAFTEGISLGQASGDVFTTMLSTTGLGNLQEADNRLYLAAETYRHALRLAGDQPLQIIYDAHLGLARVLYEWNDLATAEQHGQQSLDLARQFESVIDRFIVCEVFLARLRLARGDVAGAAAILAQASRSAHERNFVYRIPEVAGAQVLTLLSQGDLTSATRLTEVHEIPMSQARVHLAQGDASAALATLEPLRRWAESKGWEDERLKIMVLQAVAHHEHGEKNEAVQLLGDALTLAEPGGFVRIFLDEGVPMARLLSEAAAQGIMPDYTGKLLAVFEAEEQKEQKSGEGSHLPPAQSPVDQLSHRELEVLRLVAQGLSNREICERLFLALDTVKGHNRSIFGKLMVHSRTEAAARARESGLL
jgi:LuxR family maltose regulon positive regulatory protein